MLTTHVVFQLINGGRELLSSKILFRILFGHVMEMKCEFVPNSKRVHKGGGNGQFQTNTCDFCGDI